jgi:hypothetical protein
MLQQMNHEPGLLKSPLGVEIALWRNVVRLMCLAETDRVAVSRAADAANAARVIANATYWFEREHRQYTPARTWIRTHCTAMPAK